MEPESNDRQTLSRRGLLQLAGHGYLGLSLGGLLRAQAAQPDESRLVTPVAKIRSCILIFYYGGPSHIDTYDMKPGAPADIRGEFKPISTSVPGLHVCEHLPRMSRLMHKVALVRSVHHNNRLHDSASTEILTGRPSPNGDREEAAPIPQFFPSHGATLSYLRDDLRVDVPHVALPYIFRNVVNVPCQGGGFLGAAYDPVRIDVDPDDRRYRLGAIGDATDLGFERIERRAQLLASLQSPGEGLGSAVAVRQMRRFYDKALHLLNSKPLHRALDLTQEDPKLRERYGFGPPPATVGEGGGGGNGGELGYSRQMRGQN
ncbi:MAG TPA: DUF1501 domain-containing protein, partial [Pirellulales bacterium]|nr:DUF1501 domain-containing protein [Pirellulales bacterium]